MTRSCWLPTRLTSSDKWAFTSASAQSIMEGEVCGLVRRRQLDPVLEPEATRRLVDEVLSDYLDRAAMSALPPLGDADAAARTVFDQVAGFGPLQQYFEDPAVN